LQQLCRITRPGGTILLRIPLVSSYAWQTFGINWIALDAPRHFYLHTPKSMTYLAEKSGFEIRKIVYDSFEIQFWGSIQYQKNISLTDPESYLNNKKNPLFSKRELHEFKRRSIQLNRDKTGDAAGFYLVKT
ncbi:MAG: class I SAM-dependent methyltransferase, partial [Bacteroidota bacterium]